MLKLWHGNNIHCLTVSCSPLSRPQQDPERNSVLWQMNTPQSVYKVTPTTPPHQGTWILLVFELFSMLSFSLSLSFQCYWVLEYLLCVAGFLTPFPSYFLPTCVLSLFVTCLLLVSCESRHAPGFALFWDALPCPILFVSSLYVAVQFLSLFPCTDLALPTINFLCLFSNLFLFLSCVLRVSFPQWTMGAGKSSISVTMLPSLQYCFSATR